MTDSTKPIDKYLAVFTDGPVAGTTETRQLEDGKYEERLSRVVLLQNVDALFWYRATESREIQGEQHVTYVFDPEGSDSLDTNDEVNSHAF
jgi:hypothetical protein